MTVTNHNGELFTVIRKELFDVKLHLNLSLRMRNVVELEHFLHWWLLLGQLCFSYLLSNKSHILHLKGCTFLRYYLNLHFNYLFIYFLGKVYI